jgi:hypothetical protein
MPGASPRTMSFLTASCCRWARAEEAVASTMAASEVPMATGITCWGGKPKATKTSPRIGTVTAPPPMPSSPEKKPTKTPSPA